MLEDLLEEFVLKYSFITKKMIMEMKEEYKDSQLSLEDLRYELQEKINRYIKKEKKKNKNFIPLTNFVAYHQENNCVHYHLIPVELVSYLKDFIKKANGNREEGYKMYQEFFKEELIKVLDNSIPILEKNPNIKYVMGTSSKVISSHKEIFADLGFVINEKKKSTSVRRFSNLSKQEKDKYRLSIYMSREDILNKSYKKEKNEYKVRTKKAGFINNIFLIILGMSIITYLIVEL